MSEKKSVEIFTQEHIDMFFEKNVSNVFCRAWNVDDKETGRVVLNIQITAIPNKKETENAG